PAGSVQSMFQDRRRRLWLSTLQGVGQLENDRFVPFNGLPGGTTRASVEDPQRDLWIVNLEMGLFRVAAARNGVDRVSWANLHHDDIVSAALADPVQTGLWLGFFHGGIAYFANGQVRASYSAADGLGQGLVSALFAASDGTLWVATDGGLSRLQDGRLG